MSVENKVDEAKAKVKEVTGKITGDNKTEAEGRVEGVLAKAKDAAENTIEGAKDAVEGAVDDVKNMFKK